MARTLTSDAGAPPPERSGGNLTAETFQDFYRQAKSAQGEIADAAKDVAAARAVLRGVYKRAETDGINVAMLKTVIKLGELDTDELAANDRDLARYRAWLNLPVGSEPELGLAGGAGPASRFAGGAGNGSEAANQPENMSEHQRWQIEEAGISAGKAGTAAANNPWIVGTFNHQLWHEGWLKGQGAKVSTEVGVAPKRGPGRPRKAAPAEPAEAPAELDDPEPVEAEPDTSANDHDPAWDHFDKTNPQ